MVERNIASVEPDPNMTDLSLYNGNVHRAAAKITVSKNRATRGSVCIALILIMASLSEAVCPLPLIVTYVLADVNPQLDL